MTEERDQLVVANIRLANHLAERYMRTHHVPDIWRDDLRSAALEGLLQAAATFDPARGYVFPTFATWRINGEMTDQFRVLHTGRATQTGRNYHNRGSEMSIEKMAEDTRPKGRQPMPVSELAFLADPTADPAEIVEEREVCAAVWALVEHLHPEQRELVDLYFVQGLTLAEIGRLQGVTESRVCQKMTAVKLRLRYLAATADLMAA